MSASSAVIFVVAATLAFFTYTGWFMDRHDWTGWQWGLMTGVWVVVASAYVALAFAFVRGVWQGLRK